MELKINTPLSIEDIDFRIQSVNKGGYATILAYKDARVDMNRLDAVYGVGFWQKKYELINGNLFCSVGIYNKELKEWIWVQDVGTESNTEKTKGEASDAFKRACFNLGIGRELYDYPVIQVKLEQTEWELKSDKAYTTFNLKLKEWNWNSEFEGNKIISLTGKDQNGKIRFVYQKNLLNEKDIQDEVSNAVQNLSNCLTVEDLKMMKEGLTESAKNHQAYKKAAKIRYDQISKPQTS